MCAVCLQMGNLSGLLYANDSTNGVHVLWVRHLGSTQWHVDARSDDVSEIRGAISRLPIKHNSVADHIVISDGRDPNDKYFRR